MIRLIAKNITNSIFLYFLSRWMNLINYAQSSLLADLCKEKIKREKSLKNYPIE